MTRTLIGDQIENCLEKKSKMKEERGFTCAKGENEDNREAQFNEKVHNLVEITESEFERSEKMKMQTKTKIRTDFDYLMLQS